MSVELETNIWKPSRLESFFIPNNVMFIPLSVNSICFRLNTEIGAISLGRHKADKAKSVIAFCLSFWIESDSLLPQFWQRSVKGLTGMTFVCSLGLSVSWRIRPLTSLWMSSFIGSMPILALKKKSQRPDSVLRSCTAALQHFFHTRQGPASLTQTYNSPILWREYCQTFS